MMCLTMSKGKRFYTCLEWPQSIIEREGAQLGQLAEQVQYFPLQLLHSTSPSASSF